MIQSILCCHTEYFVGLRMHPHTYSQTRTMVEDRGGKERSAYRKGGQWGSLRHCAISLSLSLSLSLSRARARSSRAGQRIGGWNNIIFIPAWGRGRADSWVEFQMAEDAPNTTVSGDAQTASHKCTTHLL
jgi:hypothetical protein